MHYYVFEMTELAEAKDAINISDSKPHNSQLKFLEKFLSFKNARRYTHSLRSELPLNGKISIQMIQATNQEKAEELLHQKLSETDIKDS